MHYKFQCREFEGVKEMQYALELYYDKKTKKKTFRYTVIHLLGAYCIHELCRVIAGGCCR